MNTLQVSQPPAGNRRPPTPLWVPWAVIAGSSVVVLLLASQAFDLVLLLVFLGVVFLIERTLGDWLQDAVGPVLSKVMFLGLAVFLLGALLSFDRVRATVWHVIDTADSWGFHSVVMDRVPGVPVVAPITGDGVVGNFNPPQASPNPPLTGEADPVAGRPIPRAIEEPERTPTRIALRVGADRDATLFQADVVVTGGRVTDGSVEFLVDGRVMATVPVTNGVAQARIAGIAPGVRTVVARYSGTTRVSASMTQSSFRR